MKQPKKPTLGQKKIMAAAGLDWKNWSVIRENSTALDVINKKSGRKKMILK